MFYYRFLFRSWKKISTLQRKIVINKLDEVCIHAQKHISTNIVQFIEWVGTLSIQKKNPTPFRMKWDAENKRKNKINLLWQTQLYFIFHWSWCFFSKTFNYPTQKLAKLCKWVEEKKIMKLSVCFILNFDDNYVQCKIFIES